MDASEYRRHLAAELAAYADLLGTALASPESMASEIDACPGWKVRDLTLHLGGLHRWVAHAITHLNGNAPTPEPPADEQLLEWFAEGAGLVLAALDVDPATPTWTFAQGHNTVAFWQRRQPQEHSIHRWDLHRALGEPAALDPDLAADGVDEVVTMFWPRQVALGRVAMPADGLQLHLTDRAGAWTIGTGQPAATLSGTSADVLLALWHRRPAEDPRLTWSGDVARGQQLLTLALAP